MRRRVLLWSIAAAGGTLLVLFAISATQLRPGRLRARLSQTLGARMNADVSIAALDVRLLPRIRVGGTGITFRIKNRPDLPPFILIERFWMDLGPLSVIRHHVDTLHVDGLKIQVPPNDARSTLGGSEGSAPSIAERMLNPSKVIIEHLVTHNAELAFISRKPERRPLTFLIRDLELDDLGFDRVVPFRARLTNPLPTGLVDARGSFGPWIKDDPAETPVKGDYVFSNANLSTLNGLHGMLTSTGSFDGRITAIEVSGTTNTPDFNLALGGRPVPLSTTFAAMVDGTNGTTMLRKVDATFLKTSLSASGAVTNLPGPGRHSIDLDVSVTQGRIEDILALLSSSKAPLATGNVVIQSKVHLPPGPTSVLARLVLNGQFSLGSTRFREQLQGRIQEFSRRTQGKNADDPPGRVATNVRGRFALARGLMHVPALSFQVPGAKVDLAGTCDFNNNALALEGTLQMQASVSKAVGGVKSIFLRLVDPFFRKAGRGTVVPIKVGGTIDAPAVGLNLRRKK